MNNKIRHFEYDYHSNLLAAGEFEKVVHIWDMNLKIQLNTIETNLDFGGRRLALSGKYKLLIVGNYSEYGISAYDINTGEIVWMNKDARKVQYLIIADDEDTLIACFDNKPLQFIDIKTGKIINTIRNITRARNLKNGYYLFQYKKWLIYTDNFNLLKHYKIDMESFALLDAYVVRSILAISESGTSLRGISLVNQKELWRISIENNHFISVSGNEHDDEFYGILWNYKSGGSKLLIRIDANTGKIKESTKLKKDVYLCSFMKNYMICNNGDIYTLDKEFLLYERIDF